jgi:hypothetical protein
VVAGKGKSMIHLSDPCISVVDDAHKHPLRICLGNIGSKFARSKRASTTTIKAAN